MTGSADGALWAFLIFYVTCLLAITWFVYARRAAAVRRRALAAPPPFPVKPQIRGEP
jgi:nitrate/nitrite transporter NarK